MYCSEGHCCADGGAGRAGCRGGRSVSLTLWTSANRGYYRSEAAAATISLFRLSRPRRRAEEGGEQWPVCLSAAGSGAGLGRPLRVVVVVVVLHVWRADWARRPVRTLRRLVLTLHTSRGHVTAVHFL